MTNHPFMLKSCPFCGESVTLTGPVDIGEGWRTISIEHSDADCTVEMAAQVYVNSKLESPQAKIDAALRQLVRAWNQRAGALDITMSVKF